MKSFATCMQRQAMTSLRAPLSSRARILTQRRTPAAIRPLTSGNYRLPKPFNEPNLHYAKGSKERTELAQALTSLRAKLPLKVPAIGNGSTNSIGQTEAAPMPSEHGTVFAEVGQATEQDVQNAINKILAARKEWRAMTFNDRASIFLRAAELISGKYRLALNAATMLGQGKNPWQAEIDAAAESCDFLRYNVGFAQEIYDKQPTVNSPSHHGRTDWRPLEGFVYSVSPFNFTAIGVNLISAPAIMGNVVLWKPAPMNAYASELMYKILLEAGLPDGVIQMVNGDANLITNTVYKHREFSALSFIGSSQVFKQLYAKASAGVGEGLYRDFPRMVGETSGKNFHLVHPSADIPSAAKHTIRASFEYAGQKCSACSRIYVPESQAKYFFDEIKKELANVQVGPPEDFSAFTGPVIDRKAFDRVTSAIDQANSDPSLETIVGGTYDGSKGYFINPTLYASKTGEHELFNKELFGPVLVAYVYPDAEFDNGLLQKIDQQGGGFALTGNIFARDQKAIRKAEDELRYAAGNFYENCKITAAVIGQQTFGGSRSSGTCDKAGSVGLLQRFVAPRTLKEEFRPAESVLYPHNY